MVYYFLVITNFKNDFKPCFFILTTLKDILQNFEFVNSFYFCWCTNRLFIFLLQQFCITFDHFWLLFCYRIILCWLLCDLLRNSTFILIFDKKYFWGIIISYSTASLRSIFIFIVLRTISGTISIKNPLFAKK